MAATHFSLPSSILSSTSSMPAVNSTLRMSGKAATSRSVIRKPSSVGRSRRDLSSTTYSLFRMVAMMAA